MSKLIFLKVASASTIGIAAAGSIAYVVKPDLFSFLSSKKEKFSDNIFLLVQPKTSSSQSSSLSEDINAKTKNFKCQFNTNESSQIDDQNCTIKKLSMKADNTKKHISLSDLSSMNTEEITKASIADDKTFYKVQVNQEFLKSIVDGKVSEFDLVSNKVNSDKYVTFKILLAVDGSKYYGTTSLSVAKVSEITKNDDSKHNSNDPFTITPAATSYNCNFISGVTEVNKAENACSVHEFTSTGTIKNNLSEMTFGNFTDLISSVTKDNYYLFKFTHSSDSSKDLLTFKKNDDASVAATVTNPSSTTLKNITVTELTPAISITTNSEASNPILLLVK